MTPELPSYIMTPCEHTDEVMLTTPCHRGAKLASVLAKRVSRTTPWRYFMTPKAAEKWRRLLDGGWHAVRSGSNVRFTRELRPVSLAKALSRTPTTSTE